MIEKEWQQVAYAFNAENDANIPDRVPSPYDAMLDIGILHGVKGYWTWRGTSSNLNEAADQFAPIFWAFYRQSIVLVDWWTANVVPIFKKVNHASSANYRQVSLTSVCSKVMKHNQFPDHETSKYKMHNMVSERSVNARRRCCCHAMTSSNL